MRKKLFILCCFTISLFFFSTMNVHAYENSYTSFSIDGSKLQNDYLVFPMGNHTLSWSGAIIYPTNETYDSMSSKNMYINLNVCIDGNINTWSGGDNAYHMYVHKTGISCSYNKTDIKGKVMMIYFRTYADPGSLVYDGSFNFYLTDMSSIELINYYASPSGFLNYQTMDYTQDLNDIKNALGAIDTEDLKNVIENKFDETNEKIEETNKNLEDLNDTMNDSDTSGSQSQANGFFDGFTDNDYGLSDIITMPLTFIQGLANNSCSSLSLPLPFVDQNVTLPCMTSIYEEHFGSFLTIYQAITTGFIAYWVCINIFRMVQGFKNPDKDEIEVMDL